MTRLHHASLLVADTSKSRKFYREIIGLTECSRPDLGYPGCWFALGEQQLHLIELSNPDPISGRPEHGGHDRHIAFSVTDMDALVSRLEQHGIHYSRSRSGRNALFLRDPDGNALEFIA